MQNLAVPFRGGHLVMSLTEAEELAKALAREIENAESEHISLRPVIVTDDGSIGLDSFYGFFVQIHPDTRRLQSRAGRLFGRIVAVARNKEVSFNIVCTKCGLHVSEPCTMDGFIHVSDYGNYRIEVASLKRHADDFMTGAFHMIGPVICSDLRLLLNYL